MRPSIPMAVLALLAVAAAPVLPDASPAPSSGTFDDEGHCNSLDPPGEAALPFVDDTTTRVPVRVHVLLDVAETPAILSAREAGDRDAADAMLTDVVSEVAPVLEGAVESYDRLAVDLRLSYDVLTVIDDEPSSTTDLIQAAKDHVGGAVPPGIDAVYVATDNLTESTVKGQADCVGGIDDDEHSFAAGHFERPQYTSGVLGVTYFMRTNMLVFAHELGHLLGAQHHLTNCVESMTVHPGPSDALAVCGLMINDIGVAGDLFSSINSVIVRGYADEYAGVRD